MPELPEVETYVRELRPQVLGRTFTYVDVRWPRSIATPDLGTFAAALIGLVSSQFANFEHPVLMSWYLWGIDDSSVCGLVLTLSRVAEQNPHIRAGSGES